MWLLGALDFSVLTDGLVTGIESAFTQALPVLAVLIIGFLTIKVIRRVLHA
jgi:hypothetical protein